MNTLYYGDNLDILRQCIPDESIDLIYLDPSLNSKRGYNLLFKTPKGHESEAQVEAFNDTWNWEEGEAEKEFAEILHQGNTDVAEMIRSMRGFLKESDMMAYLVMMTNRLLEMHKKLMPTGSLYLHCDPTASHYLKVVMDTIFGPQNFRNEITWKRTASHGNVSRNYAALGDAILFYGKSDDFVFHLQYQTYSEEYVNKFYRYVDEKGRRYRLDNMRNPSPRPNLCYEYKGYKPHPNGWTVSKEKMAKLDAEGRLHFPKSKEGRIAKKLYLDEMPGVSVGNIWDDILPIQSQAHERLGYPTQKPLALLERIINASSNPGDIVLDPFCGCGTAVHAAQKLGRQWIGIDITHLSITLIEKRMKDAFPGIQFEIHGTPRDLDSAAHLARRDKYEFQWWACALVNAQPFGGKKKGADSGIDGVIYFQDDPKGDAQKVIVSVKGGDNVTRSMIADLKNSVDREKARIGLFVTLKPPTKPMLTEAASAGFYESPAGRSYPKIQILTIEGLLNGTESASYPDFSLGALTHKKARPERPRGGQDKLL